MKNVKINRLLEIYTRNESESERKKKEQAMIPECFSSIKEMNEIFNDRNTLKIKSNKTNKKHI